MQLKPATRSAAAFLAAFTVCAQSLAPQAKTQPPSTDEAIHINVNLVQVDAVVTDCKHHPVTDLKAADFEITAQTANHKR